MSSDNPEAIANLSKELSDLDEITNSYSELKKAQGVVYSISLHFSNKEINTLLKRKYKFIGTWRN